GRKVVLLKREMRCGVAHPDTGGGIKAAWEAGLRLVDLDERLERLAAERLRRVGRIDELLTAAQVGVVRDDHGIAPVARVQAQVLDRLPQPLQVAVLEGVELARRERRHVRVAEDHVAVAMAPERAAGVLVAHEAREAARRTPVVRLLGGSLDLVPYRDGRRVAVDAGRRGAERQRPRRIRNTE